VGEREHVGQGTQLVHPARRQSASDCTARSVEAHCRLWMLYAAYSRTPADARFHTPNVRAESGVTARQQECQRWRTCWLRQRARTLCATARVYPTGKGMVDVVLHAVEHGEARDKEEPLGQEADGHCVASAGRSGQSTRTRAHGTTWCAVCVLCLSSICCCAAGQKLIALDAVWWRRGTQQPHSAAAGARRARRARRAAVRVRVVQAQAPGTLTRQVAPPPPPR
jgi:hypothetical protein